jgi:glycerophosphoryl diester phosphodiesterase
MMKEEPYTNSSVPDAAPSPPDPGGVRSFLSFRPVAIAHRGGARLRPENTIAAFDHALTVGADALECDVRLSRDGEPVLIHDETLDRTSNASGPVSARTASELAAIDAGYHFDPQAGYPYRGRGLGVPRLRDLLERTGSVPVIVEIKGDDPRAVRPVLDVIAAAGARERVIIGGFSHLVLAAVREQAPAILTSASQPEIVSALRRAAFWLRPWRPAFQLVQAPLRLRGRQVLTRAFVRQLRRANLPVQAWIVDELDDMRMVLDWGVTGLITDRPDRAVEVVKQLRARNR